MPVCREIHNALLNTFHLNQQTYVCLSVKHAERCVCVIWGAGGKGDHYRTTCLVALTDRLVCAAVSAGQANTASERASEREREK